MTPKFVHAWNSVYGWSVFAYLGGLIPLIDKKYNGIYTVYERANGLLTTNYKTEVYYEHQNIHIKNHCMNHTRVLSVRVNKNNGFIVFYNN